MKLNRTIFKLFVASMLTFSVINGAGFASDDPTLHKDILLALQKDESYRNLINSLILPYFAAKFTKYKYQELMESADSLRRGILSDPVLADKIDVSSLLRLSESLKQSFENAEESKIYTYNAEQTESCREFKDHFEKALKDCNVRRGLKGGAINDITLDSYSTKLEIDIKSAFTADAIVDHEFLPQKTECLMEKEATFCEANLGHNMVIFDRLMSELAPDDFEFTIESDLIVASVGSSSTQIYTRRGPFGAFLMGTDKIVQEPSLAGDLVRAIILTAREKNLGHLPIVFVNSIGFSVEKSTNLTANLAAGVRGNAVVAKGTEAQPNKDRRQWTRALNLMCDELVELEFTLPCIIQDRSRPKLKQDWLLMMCKMFYDEYGLKCARQHKPMPSGIYVADFGGGGPDLQFFKGDTNELKEVRKDRSLRGGQEDFVQEMRQGKFKESTPYQSIAEFFQSAIKEHSEVNGVSPVVVYIRQTGMARQQHVVHNTDAVKTIFVFE